MASCHLVFQYSRQSQCGVFFALIVPALTPASLALACVLAEQIVKHTICLLGIHHAYLLGVLKYLKVQEECCYFCKDRRILEDHEIRATSVTEVGTLFL